MVEFCWVEFELEHEDRVEDGEVVEVYVGGCVRVEERVLLFGEQFVQWQFVVDCLVHVLWLEDFF